MPETPVRAGRAVTVRLSDDLYEALEQAGEMRGVSPMTEILRKAALEYVKAAAEDDGAIERAKRQHEALRLRAQELESQETGQRARGRRSRTGH